MPQFTVESELGRDNLMVNGVKIATCYTGDWKDTHGSIEKWVKVVVKREDKRLVKIEETIEELRKERKERSKLLATILDY